MPLLIWSLRHECIVHAKDWGSAIRKPGNDGRFRNHAPMNQVLPGHQKHYQTSSIRLAPLVFFVPWGQSETFSPACGGKDSFLTDDVREARRLVFDRSGEMSLGLTLFVF